MTDDENPMENDGTKDVLGLIKKAGEVKNSETALNYSQAALNSANAMLSMVEYKALYLKAADKIDTNWTVKIIDSKLPTEHDPKAVKETEDDS